MILFKKIKALAKEQGLSLLEVNDKAGLGKYSIYNWRKKDSTIDNLTKVANVLHTTIDSLLDNTAFAKKIEPHSYQIRAPILGRINRGDSILADQNIIGYKVLTFDHKLNGTLFLLECQGNSMEPLIPSGSLVTIRRQENVKNSELAAVLIDDRVTIKRIKYVGNEIILTPENRRFDPEILNESNPSIIIGKVIHVDYDVE